MSGPSSRSHEVNVKITVNILSLPLSLFLSPSLSLSRSLHHASANEYRMQIKGEIFGFLNLYFFPDFGTEEMKNCEDGE